MNNSITSEIDMETSVVRWAELVETGKINIYEIKPVIILNIEN